MLRWILLLMVSAPWWGGLRVVLSYRTDWCPKQALLSVGGLANITNVLRSSYPVVAVPTNLNSAFVTFDSTTHKPNGGFFYDVLQKVATLGSFSWNYTVVGVQEGPLDTFFVNITTNFDTVIRPATDTPLRRQRGLGFTPSLLDSTLVLIINNNLATGVPIDGNYAWLFPFTYELWGCIVAILALNAVLQYLMEWSWQRKMRRNVELALRQQATAQIGGGDEVLIPEIPDMEPLSFEQQMYESFARFTGVDSERKPYQLGRAQYILFSLFILVISCSYTANLASVLISVNSKSNPINVIDDANSQRSKVCFRKGSVDIGATLEKYPLIQVVQTTKVTNSMNEVLDMLNAGQCDAAVMQWIDWQIAGSSSSNAQCNLQLAPTYAIRPLSTGMVFKVDYGEIASDSYCTSAFGDSFSALISQLSTVDFINQAWHKQVLKAQTVTCPSTQGQPNFAQYAIVQMEGIIFFYLVVSGICLFLHLVGCFFEWPDRLYFCCYSCFCAWSGTNNSQPEIINLKQLPFKPESSEGGFELVPVQPN